MLLNTNSQFQNPRILMILTIKLFPQVNDKLLNSSQLINSRIVCLLTSITVFNENRNQNLQRMNQVYELQVPNSQPIKQISSQIIVQNQLNQSQGNQKVSYFLGWIMYFLSIAFIIIILITILCMVGIKIKRFNPQDAHNTLSTLKENLEKNPIKVIVVVRETSSDMTMFEYFRHKDVECPDGYESEYIGKWEGVKSGFLCENRETNHSITYFYKSSCK